MGIAHGHRQALVPKDFLQRQDVAPVPHEVTREGVSKDVCGLTSWQRESRCFHGFRESPLVGCIGKKLFTYAVRGVVVFQELNKFGPDWYSPRFARFGL